MVSLSVPVSKALALAVTASMAAAVPVANRVEPREIILPIVTAKLDFTHTTCAANAVKRIMQYGPALSYENAVGPSMMCEFAGGKLCGSTGLTALISGGREGDRNTVEDCPAIGKTSPGASLCYTTCVGPEVERVTLNLEVGDGREFTTCSRKNVVGGCWYSTRDGSVLSGTGNGIIPEQIASEEACEKVTVEKGTCV